MGGLASRLLRVMTVRWLRNMRGMTARWLRDVRGMGGTVYPSVPSLEESPRLRITPHYD